MLVFGSVKCTGNTSLTYEGAERRDYSAWLERHCGSIAFVLLAVVCLSFFAGWRV